MKFDPTLLSVVTGPYRILWASVYTNYPEWIDKMLIINAPSYMSLLWKVSEQWPWILSPCSVFKMANSIIIGTTESLP